MAPGNPWGVSHEVPEPGPTDAHGPGFASPAFESPGFASPGFSSPDFSGPGPLGDDAGRGPDHDADEINVPSGSGS